MVASAPIQARHYQGTKRERQQAPHDDGAHSGNPERARPDGKGHEKVMAANVRPAAPHHVEHHPEPSEHGPLAQRVVPGLIQECAHEPTHEGQRQAPPE